MPLEPLSDTDEVATCARVCYHIIVMDWQKRLYDPARVSERALHMSHTVGKELGWRMEWCLSAYAWHVARGLRLRFIRATIVQRALFGASFREALLWTYKANRRKHR